MAQQNEAQPDNTQNKKQRAYVRLEESLSCVYEYEQLGQTRQGEAIILDFSGGGIKMLSREFFKKGVSLALKLKFPFEEMAAYGEVVGIRQDWYLTDLRNVSYWTVNVKFIKISIEQRRKIIRYIYKCMVERHKAQLRRMDKGFNQE